MLPAQFAHAKPAQAQLAGEFASGHVALGAELRLAALQVPLHPDALAPPADMPHGVGGAVPDSVPGLVQLDRAERQCLAAAQVQVEIATILAAPVKMLIIHWAKIVKARMYRLRVR